MARIKTFTDGGSMLPGDLNSIQDDYEKAFQSYRDIAIAVNGLSSSGGSGIKLLAVAGSDAPDLGIRAQGVLYLNPADYAAAPRTARMRLQVHIRTNAVAPAHSETFGLYPIATWAGASGSEPTTATVSAVIAGSTVTFMTPGASASAQALSSEFVAPAAGYYALGVSLTAQAAANAAVGLHVRLQVRQT